MKHIPSTNKGRHVNEPNSRPRPKSYQKGRSSSTKKGRHGKKHTHMTSTKQGSHGHQSSHLRPKREDQLSTNSRSTLNSSVNEIIILSMLYSRGSLDSSNSGQFLAKKTKNRRSWKQNVRQ